MPAPNSGESRTGQGDGIDEFDAIDRMNARFLEAARVRHPEGQLPPAGEVWIGDDAAVVRAPTGSGVLLTTDLVVEGVHFDLDFCTLADVGYKAVMVTASDLAAMGARPDHALVSIVAPRQVDLEDLADGLAMAAADCACSTCCTEIRSTRSTFPCRERTGYCSIAPRIPPRSRIRTRGW